MVGCKWCPSGLSRDCRGPLGSDDLEVACACACHKCPVCYSVRCVTMGGSEPCERDYNEFEMEDEQEDEPDPGDEPIEEAAR